MRTIKYLAFSCKRSLNVQMCLHFMYSVYCNAHLLEYIVSAWLCRNNYLNRVLQPVKCFLLCAKFRSGQSDVRLSSHFVDCPKCWPTHFYCTFTVAHKAKPSCTGISQPIQKNGFYFLFSPSIHVWIVHNHITACDGGLSIFHFDRRWRKFFHFDRRFFFDRRWRKFRWLARKKKCLSSLAYTHQIFVTFWPMTLGILGPLTSCSWTVYLVIVWCDTWFNLVLILAQEKMWAWPEWEKSF